MDEQLNLGPCCCCGKDGADMRNIVSLPYTVPESIGAGWGCMVCGLPLDGACYVACDACIEASTPPVEIVFGKIADKRRMSLPPKSIRRPFEHDVTKHHAYETRNDPMPEEPIRSLEDMAVLVEQAMSGWQDGDEAKLLETYPDQPRLKRYLAEKRYITWWSTTINMGGREFERLGAHGNLAWCCDKRCDRVIVEMPISLYIREGGAGECTFHPACFENLLHEGVLNLP